MTRFMGPTWGPPGSCRPQVGPMLAPWTLLSGLFSWWACYPQHVSTPHCILLTVFHANSTLSTKGNPRSTEFYFDCFQILLYRKMFLPAVIYFPIWTIIWSFCIDHGLKHNLKKTWLKLDLFQLKNKEICKTGVYTPCTLLYTRIHLYVAVLCSIY